MTFLLLCSSKFNFHCYTQCETTPTQKSAQKWQLRPFMTSCVKDYEGNSLLQASFAELPNTQHTLIKPKRQYNHLKVLALIFLLHKRTEVTDVGGQERDRERKSVCVCVCVCNCISVYILYA